MTIDPKQRFTDRVDDYAKYRPDYPASLYELLAREHGLTPEHTIADLGAGTGLLARTFLERGNRVIGVEPNEAMRRAGDRALASFPNYRSVHATAEETGLPDASVGMITSGQAFHWFDPARTRAECLRILEPNGPVVLVWNNWHQATSELMRGYASIVERFTADRLENRHTKGEQMRHVGAFFEGRFEEYSLQHGQRFDRAGLQGRLLSASYSPKPGHPQHAPMMAELDRLFDAHHDPDGFVDFELLTQIFVGRLAAQSPG